MKVLKKTLQSFNVLVFMMLSLLITNYYLLNTALAAGDNCAGLQSEFETFGGGEAVPDVLPAHCASAGTWVGNGINLGFALAGGVAVLFIIIGGFKMMASGGNEKTSASGKKTLQWAVIGLVVILMSFALITIISKFVTGG
jgi:Type IV secretion system pilin